ncbi:MAG: OmpA family protein [Bacteroidota bacterium]|nr:OmpA family protein [Bacteroidota bacterium]
MLLRLIIFFIICSLDLNAQRYVSIQSAPEKLIKSYQKAVLLYQENNFAEAEKQFNKLLQKHPDFIDAYIQLGSIYYETKDYINSAKNFEKVLHLDSNYNYKVLYTLSLANYKNYDFNKAKQNLLQYLKKDTKESEILKKARNLYPTYSFADSAVQHPVPFSPIYITSLNTFYSEYLPTLTGDGKTMVFTRRLNNYNEDLFISTFDGSAWSEPIPIDEINSLLNEGAPTISPDGKTLVFVSCDRKPSFGGCDLYISKKENDTWSAPVNLGEQINSAAYESQACFADQGQTLYFVSNRKGTRGNYDIFYTTRDNNNQWTRPVSLSPEINTPLNEECPFMHSDGRTLFFSSTGHTGMGLRDLFYSKKLNSKQWSKAQNLGYPINTPEDDGALIISPDARLAIFSSDRQTAADSISDPSNNNKNLNFFQFIPQGAFVPNSAQSVIIVARDAVSKEFVKASIEIFDLVSKAPFYKNYADRNGEVFTVLPSGSEYAIHISAKGYVPHSEHIYFDSLQKTNVPSIVEIYLNKVISIAANEKPRILKNILFESGSAILKSESMFELDQLFTFLIENENLKIKFIGHTDDIGTAEDNLILSENRAIAVLNYFKLKGISPINMTAKGAGETEPIDQNKTEAGRRNNRRTEFVIIKE